MLLYDQAYKYYVEKILDLLQAFQTDVVPGSFGFDVNVEVAKVFPGGDVAACVSKS
jgi:hypothetical protein